MPSTIERLVHDVEGLNSGIAPAGTARHIITPTDQFFTRSHAAIPAVDVVQWRLEVSGLVRIPGAFGLEQLVVGFPRHEVTATLVCAGLRRVEFLSLGPLPGELPWSVEPASTGRWAGVTLRDLLDTLELDRRAAHVEFTGLDQIERLGTRFGFGGSIALDKAMTPDVWLAYELNGEALPPAHGFPVRVVVPGWIGARSVKWLSRIAVSENPSANYFQTHAYRVQRRADPAKPRDVTAGAALHAAALNSVILEPASEQRMPAGAIRTRGWAIGTGGAPVKSIELSPNDGADWISAKVAEPGQPWTWTFWEATLELPVGRHTLVVRATDDKGNTQPPSVRDTWNVKGYGNNTWHRVVISVE